MPYSIRLPDGVLVENIPDEMTPEQAKAKIVSAYPQYAPKPPSRTLMGTLGDVSTTFNKGLLGLAQSGIGLADIPANALGLVPPSKTLAGLGITPDTWQKSLDTMYSPAQQAAEKNVEKAEGFTDTVKALAENPSGIATKVGQTIPQMAGVTGIARGLMSLAPKLAPAAAAAVGEGALGAGSTMQQITEELKGVQPTPQQAGLAALTGAGTGAFSALGAKAASKFFGAADIDTMLAQGARKSATEIAEAAGKPLVKPAGFFSQAAKSGLSESVFEELPQTVQETMLRNYALDKPLTEGLGKDVAMALTVGATVGGAGGGFSAIGDKAEYQQALNKEREQAKQAEIVERAAEKAKAEADKAATKQAWVDSLSTMPYEDLLETQKALKALPKNKESGAQIKEDLALVTAAIKASEAETKASELLEAERQAKVAKTEEGMAKIANLAMQPPGTPAEFTPAEQKRRDAFADVNAPAQQDLFDVAPPASPEAKAPALTRTEIEQNLKTYTGLLDRYKTERKQTATPEETLAVQAKITPVEEAIADAQKSLAALPKAEEISDFDRIKQATAQWEAATKAGSPKAGQYAADLIQLKKEIGPVAEQLAIPEVAGIDKGTLDKVASGLDTKYTSYIPWFNANVIGKNVAEVQALVEADPKLVQGQSAKARILRELITPTPPAFVEPSNADTLAAAATVPPATETGPSGSESGLGVSVGTVGKPPASGTAAPVGGGLANTSVPAGARNEPEATIATALTETPLGTQTPETLKAEEKGSAPPAAAPSAAVETPAPTPAVTGTPTPAIPKTVKLYRGVPEGKDNQPTVGGALFMSPDRGVAETYAGANGTVTEKEVSFNNLLEAKNWADAKKQLGVPRSTTMEGLVNAAREAGHDGVTFNTTNGREYISISQPAPAPAAAPAAAPASSPIGGVSVNSAINAS